MTVLTRRSSSLSEVSVPLPFLFKTSHLTKLPAKHSPLLFEQTKNVQMWPPSQAGRTCSLAACLQPAVSLPPRSAAWLPSFAGSRVSCWPVIGPCDPLWT